MAICRLLCESPRLNVLDPPPPPDNRTSPFRILFACLLSLTNRFSLCAGSSFAADAKRAFSLKANSPCTSSFVGLTNASSIPNRAAGLASPLGALAIRAALDDEPSLLVVVVVVVVVAPASLLLFASLSSRSRSHLAHEGQCHLPLGTRCKPTQET